MLRVVPPNLFVDVWRARRVCRVCAVCVVGAGGKGTYTHRRGGAAARGGELTYLQRADAAGDGTGRGEDGVEAHGVGGGGGEGGLGRRACRPVRIAGDGGGPKGRHREREDVEDVERLEPIHHLEATGRMTLYCHTHSEKGEEAGRREGRERDTGGHTHLYIRGYRRSTHVTYTHPRPVCGIHTHTQRFTHAHSVIEGDLVR